MKRVTLLLALLASTALGACAETSANIAPAYVSPMMFADYDCAQLHQEAQRVATQAGQAMGAQDQRASNDQATMAVSMILFWPALFALNGDRGGSEAEVARLKGQMEAIEQANIQKNCGITFQSAPA